MANNFNPRSPWGERHYSRNWANRMLLISIHAPRGGSDLKGVDGQEVYYIFQSTLPVGGATKAHVVGNRANVISIHAPRGGSDRHKDNDRQI